MKKNISIILINLVLSLTSSLLSAQIFTEGNLTYKVISGTNVNLIGYDVIVPVGDLIISNTITNAGTEYTVTSIGYYVFSDCTGLTTVSIPNSVTSIGDGAFYNCMGLTSVNIPNSVTSIGHSAFFRCVGLSKISIPDSVTRIDNYAFTYCTGLTAISIPNSVTIIQISTFANCTGLTTINIPDSVTSIDVTAFYNCTGLTSLTIPNSVSIIGYSAFAYCTGLTSLTIPNSVIYIETDAFENCTGLTAVNVSWETPLRINNLVFERLDLNTIALNVSSPGIVSDYQKAVIWQDFNPINAVLSTENHLLNKNLKISPNPTKNFITISGLINKENYSIYNILDVKVGKGSFSNNEKIDAQDLTKGMYFIRLEDGNTIKFIKE